MLPKDRVAGHTEFSTRSSLLQRLLDVFFKLLYGRMAWSYDAVAWGVSVGRWKDWVGAVLPYLEGPAILEIGHGPGHLLAALKKESVRVVGMDASPQMGRLAYYRLSTSGIVPLLVNGYAQFMPFTSASFHQVVATFPTNYVSQLVALAEIRRVLVPGGQLIVLPFAWITGRSFIDRLAAWLFHITGEAPDTDTQLLTERFSEPFKRAGFSVQTTKIEIRASHILLFICTML